MKKLLKTILLSTLCLMVLTPTFANASELDEEGLTPKEKWEEKVETWKQNVQDRIDEKKEEWNEKKENQDEKRATFLEIVNSYAPELVSDFEGKYVEHDSIHSSILELRRDYMILFIDEFKDELIVLRDDLYEQFKNEEITKEEVKETLTDFRDGKKADREAIKAQYEADLADEIAEQEIRREETKGLLQELKTAIENEDAATIVNIINALYENLLEHIEFDYTKLDYIENMSF